MAFASEPPATNQGSMFCKCFLTTIHVFDLGLWLASADSCFTLLLVRLTQMSKSYLSELFHLKQINLFAVSESLLNNWVVLIEVTVF